MASTYSTNLAIELIGTGEQSGTWGASTNTNLGTLIEQAISGYVTQAITDGSGANTTITIPNGATGVARNMFIEMTGALTFSTTSLIVPANKKLYFIFNNTSGGFAVTVKVSGQTGVLVPNGKKVILTSNGTDIVEAANQVVGAFGVGGTATMAAINASGLVAMAGAATVGTTLGVTGTSTMAAINASGNINVSSSNIVLTAATGAIDMKGALTLAPASANPQIFLTDVTKGSAYLQGGVNTGGTGAGDYWIFNVPTSRGLSWSVNNSTVLNAVAAGVTIPGTLGVTGNVGIGGAGTTVPLTVRVGTDQNLEVDSSSSTLRLSAVNNARNANVGMIFQASAFALNSGPVTMNNYGVGTATFNAVGLISSVSDERLKIKDGTIADPIPMIMALEPGYYFGKPEANMGDGRQLGFYAQNVRSAIGPEAAPDPEDIVTLDEDGNEVSRKTRPWGYYDRSVLAVAIEALKVHEGRLSALQADFQSYKSSHP